MGIAALGWIVVRFGGGSSIRGSETEYEWGPAEMAEEFEHKYVGLVATIIGLVVLSLGFAGVLYNLFVI